MINIIDNHRFFGWTKAKPAVNDVDIGNLWMDTLKATKYCHFGGKPWKTHPVDKFRGSKRYFAPRFFFCWLLLSMDHSRKHGHVWAKGFKTSNHPNVAKGRWRISKAQASTWLISLKQTLISSFCEIWDGSCDQTFDVKSYHFNQTILKKHDHQWYHPQVNPFSECFQNGKSKIPTFLELAAKCRALRNHIIMWQQEITDLKMPEMVKTYTSQVYQKPSVRDLSWSSATMHRLFFGIIPSTFCDLLEGSAKLAVPPYTSQTCTMLAFPQELLTTDSTSQNLENWTSFKKRLRSNDLIPTNTFLIVFVKHFHFLNAHFSNFLWTTSEQLELFERPKQQTFSVPGGVSSFKAARAATLAPLCSSSCMTSAQCWNIWFEGWFHIGFVCFQNTSWFQKEIYRNKLHISMIHLAMSLSQIVLIIFVFGITFSWASNWWFPFEQHSCQVVFFVF